MIRPEEGKSKNKMGEYSDDRIMEWVAGLVDPSVQ